MSTRIYLVTDRETQAKRLIRAGNQAQAIRHAAQSRFDIEVAGQDDLVQLLGSGRAVEVAGTGSDEQGKRREELVRVAQDPPAGQRIEQRLPRAGSER